MTIIGRVVVGFAIAAPIEGVVFAVCLVRLPLRDRLLAALAMNACSHVAMQLVFIPLVAVLLRGAPSIVTVEALVVAFEVAVLALLTDARLRGRDVLVVAMANAASYVAGLFIGVLR
jgi:hypothetical protein